jgi:hypothetical protein
LIGPHEKEVKKDALGSRKMCFFFLFQTLKKKTLSKWGKDISLSILGGEQ